MTQFKRVFLLLSAGSLLLAGKVWAEDKAPAATTPVAKAAVKADSSTSGSMKAASALAEEGKTEEAIAAYEKMGVLKSPKAEAWRLNNEGLAYLTAATPAPEKALPLLEKSVATDATNYVALNNLGIAYEQTDSLDKAKDAYQKAIDAAKTAGADSAKAQGNLDAVQARLDKIQAKKDKAALKAGTKAVPATTTPVAGAKK